MSVRSLLSNDKIKKVLRSENIRREMNAVISDNPGSNSFNIIIDTTKAGSANNTFILPLPSVGVYDYYVDWGEGTGEEHFVVNTSQTHVYTTAGTYYIKIRGIFPRIYFNNGGDKLKLISIDNWGDIIWASFEGAFYGCSNMDCAAMDSANTSSVTSFENTFRSCSSLTAIEVGDWDTSMVTSFERTFNYCSSLVKLNTSRWNTSSVTTLAYTFSSCPSLVALNVGSWDTSSVTTLLYTFKGCFSLASLDTGRWDTSSVTSFYMTFNECSLLTILDTSGWDTSLVTTFYRCFYGCSLLTSLDVSNWDVSSVDCFGLVFYNCSSLVTLDTSNWDTLTANSFAQTFYGCSSLIALDVSNWDTSSVLSFNSAFYGCISLKGSFADLDLNIVAILTDMFWGCNINDAGTDNYDATLVSWAAQDINAGLTFHGGTSQYSAGGGGTAARAILTGAPNNWTITDGGEA